MVVAVMVVMIIIVVININIFVAVVAIIIIETIARRAAYTMDGHRPKHLFQKKRAKEIIKMQRSISERETLYWRA